MAAGHRVPAAVQGLIDLFASDLSDVHFPDVDAARLEDAAERVRVHAAALERAEAAAEAARELVAESQEALLVKAHRALAYLRVYGEENPSLALKLEGLGLPKPTKRGAEPSTTTLPKRRGRPPKSPESTTSLFVEPASALT